MSADPPYPPIGEYALLGDCHSAALVSTGGSIDWACLRRFDADSVFGRLLDWRRGGHFRIGPSEAGTSTRRYLGDTLVLETSTETPSGAVRLLDAFALRDRGTSDPVHELIRVVEGVRGRVEMTITLEPRFDYGDLRPWLRPGSTGGTWLVVGGDDALVVRTDATLTLDEGRGLFTATAVVEPGRRLRFSLHACAAHELIRGEPGEPLDGLDQRLAATVAWWEAWSSATVAPAAHAAQVRRSAVVLKGLTCGPTGAIVAAPTTSLPERIGGPRNWDYRYSWVRDSTLTLVALDAVGHREAAAGFRDFLLRSAAGHADDLQIMYGSYGQRRLPELTLELEGYRGSRPVRIGNAATQQRQLDVYGHILDAARTWQVAQRRPDPDEWRFLRQVVDAAAGAWEQPDHGIWEMRAAPRHFVYSKVMCWVALDRGIDMAERFAEYEADIDRWKAVRERIREVVEERGVSPSGHFMQSLDDDQLDASLLKLPALGFVPARDPRMLATVAAIRERLADPKGFVRRYAANVVDDGLPGGEGVFLLCTCWLVDVLALQGEVEEASRVFDSVLAAANDLGLFAEEYEPASGQLLGNFPQAFTHLGVIQSALRLAAAGVA